MASSNWLTLTIVWLLLAASVLVEANKSNLFDKSSTSSEKLSDKDRYIVLLKDAETSAVPTLAATLASTYGATLGYTYKKLLPGAFSVSKLTTQAAEALKQDERVKDVVQDRIIRVSDVQTSNLPWGLDRIDDEALPRDFSYEYPGDVAGQDVHIYIIDTGINYNHNDLKDRLSTSSSANFAPGVATDPAWNDCNGHGTHVASTAAGTKYGVAKKATLHAVKVFDCDGNTLSSSIVSAMEWASENCDGRLCVANMSLGGGRDEYFNQATNAMVATGMVVVVAAGNEDQDACGTSPASAQDAITVGSTIIGSISGNDERSYFSNFGSCLDIYAPGSNILGAWENDCSDCTETISGTSMASPHVAGVAALILQSRSEQGYSTTPQDVVEQMRTDAIRDLISDAKDGSPNLLLHMPGSLQNNPDAPPDFLEDVGYHIIHRETGKYLTLENDTCDDGVKLQLRDLDGSASQWFRFEAAYNDEDGYSNNMIVSDLCGDKAITSEGDSCLKGVDVQLSSTAGSFSQFLYPFKNGEDWVLTNTYCDRVLEVSNGVVQLNEDAATLNQKWEIVLADISEAPSMAPTGSAAPTLSMAPSGVPTSSIMPSATPSLAPSPVPSTPPSMMPSSPPTSAPTREPCAEGLTDFVFEILTDDYSYETSFDLKNDCTGATVFSKSAVDLADGEYSVYARCLPPARYTFRIRDSFGDGIFWPGYFSLVIDGVFVTQQRRDFGTQYASSFGDAGVCDGGDGDCPCDDYGFILRFLCRILNRAICRA